MSPAKKPVKKRSLHAKLIYLLFNNGFRIFCTFFYRIRHFGSRNYPDQGAALICSNHQSHMDPILIANSATNRYLNFVARESLFKFKPFGWLIKTFGAFPINREGGVQGLKETLRRLKNKEIVLIFPEGTRTPDGDLQEFKPGFCSIVRRTKVPIVPVAIHGAYDAWPKNNPCPMPSPIKVKTGKPIPYSEIDGLSDDQIAAKVKSEVARLLDELKQLD